MHPRPTCTMEPPRGAGMFAPENHDQMVRQPPNQRALCRDSRQQPQAPRESPDCLGLARPSPRLYPNHQA